MLMPSHYMANSPRIRMAHRRRIARSIPAELFLVVHGALRERQLVFAQ